jgi:predicted dehydrogenase
VLKVGLLGAGYILEAHAKALHAVPTVTLHGVCDLSRVRAAEAAATYGIPSVYSSLEQLLASDCDVVHVLLPPFSHEDAARQLLQAGKSVFIEKPMGLNSASTTTSSFFRATRPCAAILQAAHSVLWTTWL